MKAAPRSMALIFRDWVLVIPTVMAFVAVGGVLVVEKFGSDHENFVPFPFFCFATLIGVYGYAALFGLGVTAVVLIKRLAASGVGLFKGPSQNQP
jgi:hypothetical protein